MKIAIYSHSIAPSIDGVCRRFTAILHELQRQGHETLLFTMEDKPEELPKSTTFVTLDHMIFPSYPNKKVARPTCRAIFRVFAALKKFRPDIIHVVADGYSQLFTLFGLALGIPVVGSFHTDILDLLNTHGAYEIQKFLVTTKERIDSFVLDSCATTSESFKAKLANQGVSCEHVIITAVDMNIFSAKKRNEKLRLEMMFGDESGFLCVYVGRISNEKRLEVMINALKTLTGPRKAYLAIVGDGPSAGKYAKLHGPTNRIYCKPRFLNHAELAEVYASGDVHVSASQFETLGNTVLEAFSCSIPVVVPATQGFINTVNNTVNGFLFTPGDSDSARKYVQYLLDDNNLRVKMGVAGKSAVASNTITNVVKDLMQWYAVGSANRSKRSGVNKWICFLIVVGFVLLTVFMFAIYDIMVSYLLKPFISYAGDNHHVTKPREDIPRYASSDQLRNAGGVSGAASGEMNTTESTNSGSSSSSNSKPTKGKSGKKVN